MNNSHRFLCIYLLATSLFCNAAEEKSLGYRSIPFNRGAIDEPCSMVYTTDKNFAIAGNTGYEIQRNEGLNTFGRCSGYGAWKVLKDNEKIVVFHPKEIIIADVDSKIDTIQIPMKQERIIDVALDAAKNIIFIAYDSPGQKSGIRQLYYNSNSYSSGYSYNDYLFKNNDYLFKNNADCCSLALSPSKDTLCLLDNFSEITLRKTNALDVIFKKIQLPIIYIYSSCIFSPDGAKVALKSELFIHIRDDHDQSCLLSGSAMVKAMTFHPCGLLAALILNHSSNSSSIKYWDVVTKKEIDTTILPKTTGRDFCFRDDGLELAIVTHNDCIAMPIPPEVITRYVLPPLWIKLKMIQEKCNLPKDIMVHCMNVLMAYCGKKSI